MKYVTTIGDTEFLVEILDERRVIVDDTVYEVDFNSLSDQPVYSLLIDGRSYEAYVSSADDTWNVLILGRYYPAIVEDEREKRLRAASGSTVFLGADFHLKSPMPGLVVEIPVLNGQEVQQGDILLVLESMKMQNELKSPRDGTITHVRVQPGESVEKDQIMLSVV